MLSKNSGFTMVEFLVAILVLMVGLLGMLQGINLAMSLNVESMLRNEAVAVGNEAMMAQRNLTYDAVQTPAIPTIGYARNIRGIFKIYSATTAVAPATGNSKLVSVTVSWNYKNKKSMYSVSSAISTSPL